MNTLSSIKAKYKLLCLIFLPSIVFLGFILKFLSEDYHIIQSFEETRQLLSIVDELQDVTDALLDERDLSFSRLENYKNFDAKGLLDARQKTDRSCISLKEETRGLDIIINGDLLRNTIDRALSFIESLNQKRKLIDSQQITEEELNDSYMSYFQYVINPLISMTDRLTGDSRIERSLQALVNLLYQRQAFSEQRHLIMKGLIENKLSKSDYQALLASLGAEQAYKREFRELASSNFIEHYDWIVVDQSYSEAAHLKEIFLSEAPNGPFSINPQTFWNTQTASITLLHQFSEKIIEYSSSLGQEQLAKAQLEIYLTLFLILVTFTITVLLVIRLLRSLTTKLQNEIDILAHAAQEMLASITEASTGTTETATAVTETTTTMEELKQTAQVAADKAKNVSEVSNTALTSLQTNEKSLDTTVEGMNRIKDGMNTISDCIIKLSENTQAIGEIIDFVNDLSEQSHLLAVNAAIEAAKAGDQGKGFSVVAQEIRSLAEQSKQATVQVRKILNDIQNSTSAAVMATEQGSKAVTNGVSNSAQMHELTRSLGLDISKVAQAAAQIAFSSDQQLIGVDQVRIAMSNIQEASKQLVEHMKQIEIGIQNLNAVGSNLKLVIHEYKS